MPRSAKHLLSSDAVSRILTVTNAKRDARRVNRRELISSLNNVRLDYLNLKKELPLITPIQARKKFEGLETLIKRLQFSLPTEANMWDPLFYWLSVVANKKIQSKARSRSTNSRLSRTLIRLKADTEYILSLVQLPRNYRKGMNKNKLGLIERLVMLGSMEPFERLLRREKMTRSAEGELIKDLGGIYYDAFGRRLTWNKTSKTGQYEGPATRFAQQALIELGVVNPRTKRPFTENQIGELWDKAFTKRPREDEGYGVIPFYFSPAAPRVRGDPE